MNRFFIILSTLLALLSSCSGKQQGEQTEQPQNSGKFDITGTWMLVNMTDHEGRLMDMIRNRNFLSCAIYESDSTYYDVNLWAVDGKTYLFPRASGQYELNDTWKSRGCNKLRQKVYIKCKCLCKSFWLSLYDAQCVRL